MSELPKAPVKRVVTSNGKVRISEDALIMVCDAAEKYLENMGSELIDLAEKDKRKTIKPKDVEEFLANKCNC
ncbi:histone family protein [Methanobrevibacter sp.]